MNLLVREIVCLTKFLSSFLVYHFQPAQQSGETALTIAIVADLYTIASLSACMWPFDRYFSIYHTRIRKKGVDDTRYFRAERCRQLP